MLLKTNKAIVIVHYGKADVAISKKLMFVQQNEWIIEKKPKPYNLPKYEKDNVYWGNKEEMSKIGRWHFIFVHSGGCDVVFMFIPYI